MDEPRSYRLIDDDPKARIARLRSAFGEPMVGSGQESMNPTDVEKDHSSHGCCFCFGKAIPDDTNEVYSILRT